MIPTYEEFYKYFEERMKKKGDDPKNYTEWLDDKYEAWKLNDWKKEQKGKLIAIKNWKSTLNQCLAYRSPNRVKNLTVVTNKPPVNKIEQPLKMTEEEKNINAELNIIYAYDEWKQRGRIAYSYPIVTGKLPLDF